MEEIQIKLLLKAIDGTIAFIEFVENRKNKLYRQIVGSDGAAAIKSI